MTLWDDLIHIVFIKIIYKNKILIINSYMNIYFPEKKGIDISKLQISNVGKYSISKPDDALLINKIIFKYLKKNKKFIITDATANNGGNTIHFAFDSHHVNAIEIDTEQFNILKHNINTYGLKNVTLYNDDYLNVMKTIRQDVIFIDAPWGGPLYYKIKDLDLFLGKQNIVNVVKDLYDVKAFKLCVLKVPRNYNFTRLFNKILNIKFDIYSLPKFKIICIYTEDIL